MEMWKKQKKIGIAFCIFLSLMFLCTLISRAVYASGLPQVTTKKPERTALIHRVEAEGIVQQGMEYAVNALSGLRRTDPRAGNNHPKADTDHSRAGTEQKSGTGREKDRAGSRKRRLRPDGRECGGERKPRKRRLKKRQGRPRKPGTEPGRRNTGGRAPESSGSI